jgi:hypothetical protein
MSLDPSQIINNIKRSFNALLSTELSGSTINFDQDPFDTSDLGSWYSVRYSGYSTESTGMSELIDEDTEKQGRYHVLRTEISAWTRDDQQRVVLGGMVDKLVVVSETVTVPLYSYAVPESPVEIGSMLIRPGKGSFTPTWGGGRSSGGAVWKSSGDEHAEGRITGYVIDVEIVVVAEI